MTSSFYISGVGVRVWILNSCLCGYGVVHTSMVDFASQNFG